MRAKINFITLAVKDLAASKIFYEQAFLFPVAELSDALCLFALEDDFYLTLQQTDTHLPQAAAYDNMVKSAGFILSHKVDQQTDVEEIVKRVELQGGKRISTLVEEWGYSVTVTDLDGHHWEILYTA